MTAKQRFIENMYFLVCANNYKDYEKVPENKFKAFKLPNTFTVLTVGENKGLSNLTYRTKSGDCGLVINEEANIILLEAKNIDVAEEIVKQELVQDIDEILDTAKPSTETIHKSTYKNSVLFNNMTYKVLYKC